jgi:hypothetical protein
VWDTLGVQAQAVAAASSGSRLSQPLTAAGAPPGSSVPSGPACPAVHRLALWRAHSDCITALAWLPPPSAAAAHAAAAMVQRGQHNCKCSCSNGGSGGSKGASCGVHSCCCCCCCLARSPLPTKESTWHATSTAAHQHTRQHAGFIVTGGLDGRVALWSSGGALVGMFGSHTWELEDASSWQTQHAAPLQVRTCTEHALLSNSILLAVVARSMHDRRVAPREACKCLLTTGKLRIHHCCTTTTASTTPRHRSASTCALLPGRQCHPVEQMPRLEPVHAAQAKRKCAFRAQKQMVPAAPAVAKAATMIRLWPQLSQRPRRPQRSSVFAKAACSSVLAL